MFLVIPNPTVVLRRTFAILKWNTKEEREPHSKAATKNGADDCDQHHSGAHWKCISWQGHEKCRVVQFGTS
jgi:hypothetical protein